MKSGIWLSRRMLRGLIVLLALMPIVPAMLLLRTQVQNAERDRDIAVYEATSSFQIQLALFASRLSMTTSPQDASAEGMQSYLRQVFGEEASIHIARPSGKWVVQDGPTPTYTAIEAKPVIGGYRNWTVIVDGIAVIPDHIPEQLRAAWRSSLLIVSLVAIAAGIAWFTVNRGLRVDELRSDLIATVSHEMKTPLASMRVLLETMEESGDQLAADTRREYLQLLTKENDRLSQLTDRFLTWSRLEKGEAVLKSEPVSVATAVASAIRRLESRIADLKAKVDTAGIDENATVLADPNSLGIVLANLIENGLKYGGSPPEIRVVASADGRVSVRDNGDGVPAEIRKRVFGRYFKGDRRLSDDQSGVGLGLAICRQLVRKMKGRIEISRDDASEFVLHLRPASPVS